MTQMTSQALAINGGSKAVDFPLPGSIQGVLEIGQPEIDAVTAVLRRKTIWRFLNDDSISESAILEQRFREMLNVDYTLAVGGGGTGALICALVGLGIGTGDEVIVPAYTYIATAAACLSVGAIPIICEVDESLTMDPEDLAKKVSEHTRAIIPVHMRGTVADMAPIMAVARRRKLKVLEDCAQCNGGSYHGQPVGSIGHAGAFSMQHYKMITAGEGGIVSTDDIEVFRRAAVKHDSAMQFWKADGEWPSFAGENYRMDEMRAALALVQLDRMPDLLERCRQAKRLLRGLTADLPHIAQQQLPDEAGDIGVVFNFFCRTADEARSFSEALDAEGVPNGTVYNKSIPDRHIYHAWDYVLEKRTSDPSGWPWTHARREIEYHHDMCPQTLSILGRCITIGLNQNWTPDICRSVAGAIRKVHNGLLD